MVFNDNLRIGGKIGIPDEPKLIKFKDTMLRIPSEPKLMKF